MRCTLQRAAYNGSGRAESPYRTVAVTLHGLDPEGRYELAYDVSGLRTQAKGADLMKRYEITLPERHWSDLIVYRGVGD